MALPKYHTGARGYPGYEVAFTDSTGATRRGVIPAYVAVGEDGNPVTGGGGGGGGAVTIADGADVALGARADTSAPNDTGAFSLIALFKRSLTYLATMATAANKPTTGTNLSGTATTTSGAFNLPANAARKPGDVQGQNISTVAIGFNEFGGTAVIGQPGTYTVPAGAAFSITTTNLVNFIAQTGTAAVTMTGL